MYKDSLSTIYPRKPCNLTLLAVDQWGDPSLNGRKVSKNVLPDFSGVTTDSRWRRIEQFGDGNYRRPMVDYGM